MQGPDARSQDLQASGRALVRRPAELASLLLPRGTVGYDVLVHVGLQRFVHFRQRIAKAKPLREALASDGGWPMHIDATGEDGQGTLLVIYAGWRGWVLGSWRPSFQG